MSKFTESNFYDGNDTYAVSAEKFTKEQAIEKAAIECEMPYVKDYYLAMTKAWVRWQIGYNEDNERVIGWWLSYDEKPRSCPVWAFHSTRQIEKQWGSVVYEYIEQHGSYAEEGENGKD